MMNEILEPDRVLVWAEVQSLLLEKIKDHHFKDGNLCFIRDKVLRGAAKEVIFDQVVFWGLKGRYDPRMGDDYTYHEKIS